MHEPGFVDAGYATMQARLAGSLMEKTKWEQ